MSTLSFLDLFIQLVTNAGPDKRWEATRDILEKEGIGKVIYFTYATCSCLPLKEKLSEKKNSK